jgi:hypothetical protein
MQKRFYVIWLCLLFTGLLVNSNSVHGALTYRLDVLEQGNPGGWEESLKTFDDEWTIAQSETIDVDIWLHDVPRELLTAGFWIEFNPEQISIASIEVYDGSTFSGPWDPGFTNIIPDADGPGTFFVACGQFSCVDPDTNDIILGKIQFQYTSQNDSTLTIQTIPGFDTIVQCPEGVLDQEIISHKLTLHQAGGDITGCDDGIACTIDSSGPDDQCSNIPDDTLCDDGLFCNGTETCDPLSGCQMGSNPCGTQEECDEETDKCISLDELPLSFRLIPKTHFRSHWFPLPLFMFIRSKDEETKFDDSKTTLHFADEDIFTPPVTMVLSENLIYVFSLIRPAGFGSKDIIEVETTVTTDEGSGTGFLHIITLPFF